ncbi:hypothetical protein [Rhizobium skierniewicense]|uniref:hypothetical protein n=1 Tax=Rhizobium skierniewicense TaxID=984260 RepID=UPI001573AD1B|nr:hypothetical protein [Rhizobium skierniewicense]NTF33475.1 hypothetical protein [Rhizobium skierniewicense]
MFAYAPAFVIGLQIFVLGPLVLVIANKERSPISVADVFREPLAISLFFSLTLGFLIFKFQKKWNGRVASLSWAFALYLLIQFFIIIPDLGVLDGRVIDFADHRLLMILELSILITVLVIAIVFPRQSVTYLSRLVIFAFVLVSIQTTLSLPPSSQVDPSLTGSRSSDFFRDAEVYDVLQVGKENAIVILVDTLQGDAFEKAIYANPDLASRLSGFTFYNNTTGHFPFTALSVPAILSGTAYAGKGQSLPDYRKDAGFRRLESVFEGAGLRWGRIPLGGRASFLDDRSSKCRAFATLYDAYLFRQLPLLIKPMFYSNGEMQLEKRCGASVVPNNPSGLDLAVLEKLSKETAIGGAGSKMVFIHLWGMHPPANLSSGCEVSAPNPSMEKYLEQAPCIIGRVANYIDRLRSIGAFEKSSIFIVADHGTRYGFFNKTEPSSIPEFIRSSANPTLLYHSPGQSEPLSISNSQIEITDIYPTITHNFGLEDGSRAKVITAAGESEERERTFLFYKGITDTNGEFLPQYERFSITGDVKSVDSWKSLGVETEIPEKLESIKFGTNGTSKLLNYGWSEEAKGVPVSWVVASPATITGTLPCDCNIRVSMRIMNPHNNQSIVFKINNQIIAVLNEPSPTGWVERDFRFDASDFGPGSINLVIEAAIIKPISTADVRNVGIAFDWIKLEKEK